MILVYELSRHTREVAGSVGDRLKVVPGWLITKMFQGNPQADLLLDEGLILVLEDAWEPSRR